MMRWIVGSSIKYRFLVVGFATALVFVGVGEVRKMPVDVFPEFAPPRVEIQTAGARAHLRRGRVPDHRAAGAGPPGHPRARCHPLQVGRQVSQIVLLFERGTDLLKARQLVPERIETATPTLPTWASPP